MNFVQAIIEATQLNKGDHAGHEFHGNQHSGGGGGNSGVLSTSQHFGGSGSLAAHMKANGYDPDHPTNAQALRSARMTQMGVQGGGTHLQIHEDGSDYKIKVHQGAATYTGGNTALVLTAPPGGDSFTGNGEYQHQPEDSRQ